MEAQVETGLQAVQQLIRDGKLAEAAALCDGMARQHPDIARILTTLGALRLQLGDAAAAVAAFESAARLAPDDMHVLLQLAIAQFRSSRRDAAEATLERLLQREPTHAIALLHRGLLREMDGALDAAELDYATAARLQPDCIDAWFSLGKLHRRRREPVRAVEALQRARALAPDRSDIGTALAWGLIDAQRYAEALALAQTVTAATPSVASAWLAQGIAARNRLDHGAALSALTQATTLAPRDAVTWIELASARQETGDFDGARAALAQARDVAPEWRAPDWLDAVLLPVLPDSDAVAERGCDRFAAGVERLLDELADDASSIWRVAGEGVRRTSPFYLHYLPRDTVAASLRFGDLVSRVVAREYPDYCGTSASIVAARPYSARRRVGFVCSALRRHTLTRYFSRWLTGLPRRDFELFAWNLSPLKDEVTRDLAASIEHFSDAAAADVRTAAAAIRDAALDVLVHLDVGLDGRSQMLAAMRLAPVQCAAYGHPATTGLSSIDFFLSGDAMEPVGAAAHYRERLVRLPGIGVLPAPPGVADMEVRLDGSGRPLLLCLQSVIKLIPRFDRVLADVAAATMGTIVLFEDVPELRRRLCARLARSFSARGLDVGAHVSVLPRQRHARYLGAIAAADVVLDSPHFSGGSTSLDALGLGTPVVTWPGCWMRGRQTAGMLRVLGVEELIAANDEDYVRIVAELCADAARREALCTRLRAGHDRLFAPADVLPALERFLHDPHGWVVAPGM
jgi:predicted O-linked N-acetylglucosamine transferase (SPINDLY family)